MTAALISGLSATCILVSWIVIVGRLYKTVFIENDEKREAKQKSK
jgi:archaellum component FlaF (FlaF/FlaG flagellin family)